LLVGIVGADRFDASEEVLLDVKLADMRDSAALDGIVGEEFGSMVNDR
jgi:hypothetical protein